MRSGHLTTMCPVREGLPASLACLAPQVPQERWAGPAAPDRMAVLAPVDLGTCLDFSTHLNPTDRQFLAIRVIELIGLCLAGISHHSLIQSLLISQSASTGILHLVLNHS